MCIQYLYKCLLDVGPFWGVLGLVPAFASPPLKNLGPNSIGPCTPAQIWVQIPLGPVPLPKFGSKFPWALSPCLNLGLKSVGPCPPA